MLNPLFSNTTHPTDCRKPALGRGALSGVGPYLVPLVILLLAYAPSFAPFGLHNDYSFLELKTGDWWLRYDESWFLYLLGRPIAAALMSCQMLMMKDPYSFVYWRIAAALMAVVLARQFAVLLCARTGYSREQGVLWGTLFLLLPAAQLSVVWIAMVMLGFIAPAIGLLAYRVMPEIHEPLSMHNLLYSFRTHGVQYMTTLGLLVIAMLIYPINAIVGLVITAAIVLGPGTGSEKQCVVVRDCIVFGGAMIVYFVLVKSQVLPLAKGEIVLPMYQLKLSFSITEQLKNLVNIVGISAASPWHVITGMPVGIALNLIILCALVFLVGKSKLLRPADMATTAILLLVVILVANAPVLLAPKGFYNAYRTGFATQTMVWLIAGTLLGKLSANQMHIKRFVAMFVVTAALGSAFYNCLLVRRVCSKEFADVITAASRAVAEKRDLVYLLKARDTSSGGWPPRFEFALPITHAPHLSGALSGLNEAIIASGITIAAIDENGAFRVLYGETPQQNAFVCDMRLPDSANRQGLP